MTKPRKEQVLNLKTNYVTVSAEHINANYATSNVYGMINDTGNAIYSYDDFVSQVPTGLVSGADQDCPAFIWRMRDQNYGLFSVNIGDSFTVSMSSLNSGSPMTVEIEAGDLSTIGGSSVLTNFALVDRINAVLASYGASVDGCGSFNGRLWIRSVSPSGVATGSDQTITITETTVGILSVLGFTNSTSVSANGRNGSTRGLVTHSLDGFGGYVECRDSVTGERVTALNTSFVRDITKSGTEYMRYFPEEYPLFARVWYSPGPLNDGRSIDLTYWARFSGYPSVVFRRPNIAALDNTDSITVTFKDAPAFGSTVSSWTTTFSSIAGITLQQVVDQINSAWSSSMAGGALDNDPRVVYIRLSRGPYSFPSDTALKFGPVTVSFSAGQIFSELQLRNHIQDTIDTFGLAPYLSCEYNASTGVDVISTSLSGLTVEPSTSTDTEALSILGINSGSFRGISVAKFYGSDAIQIECPILNSQIIITCSSGTAAKLGISTSTSVSSVNQDNIAVLGSSVDLSLPQSIEFWEVPDNVESQNRQFFVNNEVQESYINTKWMDAQGSSSLIGSDLKILNQFLPRNYPTLSIQQISLMNVNSSGVMDFSTPKIMSMHGTGFSDYNLLVQSTPEDSYESGSVGSTRIFTNSTGIVITNNARRINSTNSWISDVDGPTSSFMWVISEDTIYCQKHSVSTGTSWSNSSWDESSFVVASSVRLEGSLDVTEYLNFQNNYPTSPDLDSPQMTLYRVNKGNNPSGNQKYFLIMESPVSGSGAALPIRIYMSNSLTNTFNEASINGFMFTVNARWDQNIGNWTRDVTTESATAWVMIKGMTTNPGISNTRKAGFGMLTSNVNNWTDSSWVKTGYYSYTRDDLNGVTSGMTLYGKSTVDIGPGLNYLSADNIVRSWGKIIYANPPVLITDGGTPATQVQYNVASASRVSTGVYQVNYSTNVGTANTVLVSNISGNTTVQFSVDSHSTSNFRMAKTVAGSLADTSYAGSHITLGNTTSVAFFPS